MSQQQLLDEPASPMKRTFSTINIGKYVAEFIGTMFLVLIIKLGSADAEFGNNTTLTPFAIGFGLMILVYKYGWASGAQYNPSVTIAVIIRGGMTEYGEITMYLLSQIIGGIIGGWLSYPIGGYQACMVAPSPDQDEFTLMDSFMAELVFTFFLTSVVLHVGTHQDGNQFYGLAIGLSVFISILCIGNISGCVINPAVWIGLMISALTCVNSDDKDSLEFKYIWVYLLSEIIGGILSGLVFKYVFIPVIMAQEKESIERQRGSDSSQNRGRLESGGISSPMDNDINASMPGHGPHGAAGATHSQPHHFH